jgi:hypothetical protein
MNNHDTLFMHANHLTQTAQLPAKQDIKHTKYHALQHTSNVAKGTDAIIVTNE